MTTLFTTTPMQEEMAVVVMAVHWRSQEKAQCFVVMLWRVFPVPHGERSSRINGLETDQRSQCESAKQNCHMD
jgi:hypothetical protein